MAGVVPGKRPGLIFLQENVMTGDIEWIKLSTAIFKDEKMEVVLSMPDGEAIFLTWIRLLCLAGKINDHGLIYLAPGIRYTDDTLATIFHKNAGHVKLAMDTFQRLGIVISRDDGVICVVNWEKYQNAKGLDDIREANRIRNIEYRKRQKTLLLAENDGHMTSRVISRDRQEIEIELERKRKRKSKKDPIPKKNIDNSEILVGKGKEAEAAAADKLPPSKTESSLFHAIQDAMLSKNNGTFTDWKKEGGATKIVERRCRALKPEDPEALALAVVRRLWELKQGTDQFWCGQPFTPSTLASAKIWDRIVETMRDKEIDPDLVALVRGFDTI